MNTALDTMKEIEANASTHGAEVRMVRTMKVGEWFRQGDVAVQRVDTGAKMGAVRGSKQVAVGTSVGSRHIVEGDAVTVHENPKASDLVGPYIVAQERCILTHPEHAHVSMPAGTYVVTYQRDETTNQRVMD